MSSKIYAVETLCSFKNVYFVEAKNESDAMDEVVCKLDDSLFVQGYQKFIDEPIMDCRELTEKEYVKLFKKENSFLSDWTKEQMDRYINKIDYEE